MIKSSHDEIVSDPLTPLTNNNQNPGEGEREN